MNTDPFVLSSVSAVVPLHLRVQFADGLKGEVDLTGIVKRSPVLRRLREAQVFLKTGLDEWHRGVTFADDDNLTLASDNLRAWLLEQQGQTSHQQFMAWMHRHDLTLDAAAEALGLSRRMVAYYRSGAKAIPKTVTLAMVGWETCQAA